MWASSAVIVWFMWYELAIVANLHLLSLKLCVTAVTLMALLIPVIFAFAKKVKHHSNSKMKKPLFANEGVIIFMLLAL